MFPGGLREALERQQQWFHINVLNDTFNDDDTIQNIDNSTELIETLIDDDKEHIKDYHDDDDQQDEDEYQQIKVVNMDNFWRLTFHNKIQILYKFWASPKKVEF